jgi:hypothetical protein
VREGAACTSLQQVVAADAGRQDIVAARHSAIDINLDFPRARQQFVETVYGVAVDHARAHIAQVGVGLDVIQLAGFDQRTQHGPPIAAAVAAREEMSFSSQSISTPDQEGRP